MQIIYSSYGYYPTVHRWTERKFSFWYYETAWQADNSSAYLSPSEGNWIVPGTICVD